MREPKQAADLIPGDVIVVDNALVAGYPYPSPVMGRTVVPLEVANGVFVDRHLNPTDTFETIHLDL